MESLGYVLLTQLIFGLKIKMKLDMTQNNLFLSIVFFLIFFVSPLQANTFIMWAEGDGATLKEAKASAVTALSQQVISKVKSSFKTELSVNNDDVNRDSKSVKQIKSNLILKGVIYVDEVRSGDNIKITAGLDRAAVRSTIDYMKKQLNVEFTILSMDKKEEKLSISDQLTAFLSVLPGSILNDFEGIEAWNKSKRDLILKNIFMGRIVFVSNTPGYSVTIDKKPVESGVFLEDGSYQFTASAEGQRTMTGHFSASGGETIKVSLDFVKAVSNKKMSLHLPEGYDFLREELSDTLADLGINVQSDVKNILAIRIKDSISEVEGYVSHNIKIRIEAYRQITRIKKVTVRKNVIIQQGESNTVQSEINKLVRKGTIALLSKMDLDEYFQD